LIKSLQRIVDVIKKPALDLLRDQTIEEYYVSGSLLFPKEELLDFFENASIGLHWVDSKGTIIWANEAEMKLLGYAPKEYIGRHIRDFHADQPVIEDILTRLKRNEILHNYEARLRCKDGSIRDVLINSSVLWQNGEFIHTRCFTQDITEKKRLEQKVKLQMQNTIEQQKDELRASHELLSGILNNSPHGIMAYEAIRDPSGRIADFRCTMANVRSSLFTGRAPEETVNKTLSEIWAHCNPSEIISKYAELVEENKTYRYKQSFTRDGETKWFYATSTKLGDGYTITFEDISDWQNAENTLQAVTNSSPCSIYTMKAVRENGQITDFQYTMLNPATGEMSGKPVSYFLHKRMLDVLPHLRGTELFSKLAGVVETDVPAEYEYSYELQGRTRWIKGYVRKLEDGLATTAVDITPRKELEQMLSSVLNSSTSAITAFKAIRNEEGRIIDFEIALANNTAETLTGKPQGYYAGRRFLQEHPGMLASGGFERMVRVVETGVTEQYETFYPGEGVNKWLYTVLVKMGDGVSATVNDISERKDAEERLRQNDLFIQQITDTAPSLIAVYEPATGKYLFVSEALEKILGYKKELLLEGGLGFIASLVHPDDFQSIMQKNEEAMRDADERFRLTGRDDMIVSFEYRLKHKEGHWVWVNTFGIVFKRDHEGNIQQLLNISVDISAQKYSEIQLQESQYLLKQITDSTPNILYVYNLPDNRVSYVNREVEKTLGYPAEEFKSFQDSRLQEIFHPVDYRHLVIAREKLRDPGQTGSVEIDFRVRHSNGNWRWLHSKETAFKRSEDGGILQILGIAQDITDRRSSMEDMRQMNESLQNAIEGIAILDENGCYLSVNNAKAKLLGYHPEELKKLHWLETIHPEDREKASYHIEELKRTGKVGFEIRGLRKDGQLFFKEVTFVRNVDESENFKGWYSFIKDITERKRYEQSLIESKIRFEAIFNQTFQFISLLSPDGRIVESNNSALKFRKINIEDIKGRYFYDLETWTDPTVIKDAVLRASQGELVRHEIEIRRNEKEMHVVDFSLKPVYNENQTILYLVAEGRDITERIKAEKELIKSRALLAEAEEVAHHGSWEWVLHDNILIWSDELYRIYGIPLHEPVTFERFASLLHPDDSERVLALIEEAIIRKEPFSFEHRIVHPSGEVRVLYGRGKILVDADGEVVKLLGSAIDITEQKQAYEQLLKTEGLYRALAKNIPKSAVLLFDSSYQLTLADGAALSHLDIGEEVIGKQLSEVVLFDDDFPDLAEVLNGREYSFEKEIKDCVYRCEVKPVKNSEGAIFAGMMVLHDITDIRKYQDELEFRIEELNRSNTNLEQFAYVASHDLQEPLRKIRTFGGRLEEKYSTSLGDDGKDFINRMLNAAQRMQVMIDDLLSYSRLSRSEQIFEPTDLNLVIKEILNDLEITVEQKKAVIKFDKLPVVEAVKGQMYQLFQNIISNALKFSRPDESPEITITCETASAGEFKIKGKDKAMKYCKIAVRDNGIGFDEKYSDRIFTIFQRLHGRSEYAGTGIGLAICKKIVENHNGTISAKSRENKGSVFTITLPVKQQIQLEQQLSLSI
jgi:PAS domain S-box-containing protein